MAEEDLILQIQNGDKDAFRIFIEKYQKLVLNICYKFVNDRDDANDIAQEVFIQVYRTISKFRRDSKITTWLYRIAVNNSLNFIRKNKKYKDMKSSSDESAKEQKLSESNLSTPESDFIDNERKLIMNKAIDSLPEMQKAAFILIKKELLSYKEAGDILGISVKACESLISRAKINLQAKLIKYYK